MPTVATAVIMEQPALIQRRLRRSLKKRSHVSWSSGGDDGGGDVVVEALRVCIDFAARAMWLDGSPVDLVCFSSFELHDRGVCWLNAARAAMGERRRGAERRAEVDDRGQKRAAIVVGVVELVLMDDASCECPGSFLLNRELEVLTKVELLPPRLPALAARTRESCRLHLFCMCLFRTSLFFNAYSYQWHDIRTHAA